VSLSELLFKNKIQYEIIQSVDLFVKFILVKTVKLCDTRNDCQIQTFPCLFFYRDLIFEEFCGFWATR